MQVRGGDDFILSAIGPSARLHRQIFRGGLDSGVQAGNQGRGKKEVGGFSKNYVSQSENQDGEEVLQEIKKRVFFKVDGY